MTSDRPADAGSGGDGDALATAAGPIFADSATDRRIPRSWVASWALWDAGGAAFNAVITTFVFTVYLTSEYFISPALLAAQNAEKDTSGPAHHAQPSPQALDGMALGLEDQLHGQRRGRADPLGLTAHAYVGPSSLLHTVVTDVDAPAEEVAALEAVGTVVKTV